VLGIRHVKVSQDAPVSLRSFLSVFPWLYAHDRYRVYYLPYHGFPSLARIRWLSMVICYVHLLNTRPSRLLRRRIEFHAIEHSVPASTVSIHHIYTQISVLLRRNHVRSQCLTPRTNHQETVPQTLCPPHKKQSHCLTPPIPQHITPPAQVLPPLPPPTHSPHIHQHLVSTIHIRFTNNPPSSYHPFLSHH